MSKACWNCKAPLEDDEIDDDLDKLCAKCSDEITCRVCDDEDARACSGAKPRCRCRCRVCHPRGAKERAEDKHDDAREDLQAIAIEFEKTKLRYQNAVVAKADALRELDSLKEAHHGLHDPCSR